MISASQLAVVAAGVFFLAGLLTGTWKYLQIRASETARAHPYVDICHRASLLYAFAAMLLAEFARISKLPDKVEVVATALVLLYFAIAIATYFVHGLLGDTDNQLKPPFRLGAMPIPGAAIGLLMWTLIVAEIGGFLVLFYGVIDAIF